MPVVFINGYVEGLDAPFFSTDDRAAMRHRRRPTWSSSATRTIGLAIGPARFAPSHDKREGFVEALGDELGLSEAEARGWIAEGLFTVEGGAAAARALSTGAPRPSCAART